MTYTTPFCNHINSFRYCGLVDHKVMCPYVKRFVNNENVMEFIFSKDCNCPRYEPDAFEVEQPKTIEQAINDLTERLDKLEYNMDKTLLRMKFLLGDDKK